ncbi:cytochrome C [Limnohabitans sp. T6-5]|uniref:c-type cytochrome n=1 Tax=Limnohabitans sp. T6-5 TaxID=1100724 RepID=UPI000D3CD38A|nr:cytochrome C [Limnohabitans sp. T6-5]PUE05995.1 cytochrome C [Limnohabitans sp. T6-5]
MGFFASSVPHAHEVHGNIATTLGRQVVLHANAPSISPTHSARALYVLHCAGCHSLDGSGSISARVPDMRQLGLFLRVPGGREFLIQVPGVMGSGLNDAQVAEVTNWVLNTLAHASMPPNHRAYDAAEVHQARLNPLVDVSAARGLLVHRAQQLGLTLALAP